MSINGFSHVAIGVSDADRALPFYRDVLGLEVSLDIEERGTPPRTQFHRRAVYLRWAASPQDRFVVLDQQLDKPPKGQAKPLFEVGIHHFAFAVDDVGSILDRARGAGVEVKGPFTYNGLAYGVSGGEAPAVETAILKDPDGNLIQLDRWFPPER